MSETGCGFQRAEDRHTPEWFCVVHQCWSSTPDLCPLQRAEAATQRVRDVCDLWQRRYDSSIRHPTDIPAVAIVAVLRALDGDGDA